MQARNAALKPRRAGWVAALIAAAAVVASASAAQAQSKPVEAPALNVLFFGNSHLLSHNVPERVRKRLARTYDVGRRVSTHLVGFNGARLSQFAGRSSVSAILGERAWDVVVLQEATASFLTPAMRAQFVKSVRWFIANAPPDARIILLQTWPWLDHHLYFRRDLSGGPRSSAHFWTLIDRAYTDIAQALPVSIAPVGRCWVRSPDRAQYYSRDGNHATIAGSNYVADVVARTISAGPEGAC